MHASCAVEVQSKDTVSYQIECADDYLAKYDSESSGHGS